MQNAQEKPKGTRRGLRPIADKHQVNHQTLANLANGGRSMSAFNASKRKLGIGEEQVLVDFILESADRSIPLSNGAEQEQSGIQLGKD